MPIIMSNAKSTFFKLMPFGIVVAVDKYTELALMTKRKTSNFLFHNDNPKIDQVGKY